MSRRHPNSGVNPTGWVPFEQRTPEQLRAHERIVAAMPRFAIRGRTRLTERRYPLWQAAVKLLGKHLPYIWQVTGSCVGAGGCNMLMTLMCVEAALKGEPEEFRLLWWPFTYGMSRYRSGMRGRGEGSTGSGWAEAITADGIFQDDGSGGELADFQNAGGWLKLSAATELEWSDGSRVPAKWRDAARSHLVRTAARMRSANDCAEALANGYPITQASNFGFSPMAPRPQGNPPVRLAEWNGSWSHQTYIDEFWDHPSLGPIFRWGNNWGPQAHGSPVAGEPPGGVYIRAETLDRICRTGEVYAFSAFDGFPARELTWLI